MKLAASFALVLTVTLAACSSAPPPKQQSPKKGATAGSGTGSDALGSGSPEAVLEAPIGLARADATALQFTSDRPVSLGFKLTNASGKEVIVGLLTTPKGPTLKHDLATDSVTFAWTAPVVGTQKIRFILRDKAKCVAAESDAARCEIKPEDFGVLGANDKYDVVSDEYALEVTQGLASTAATGATGTGTGALSGLSGLAGGNGAMISQITGLLGGGGNLTSMLSGLGGGQLQQVLALVKGGGSGADVSTLIHLLKGLGLADGG